MAGHVAAPGSGLLLLARQPGPRVHFDGPRVADPALRGTALLARAARPRAVARAEEAGRDARARRHGVPVGDLLRALLRGFAHLGPAHALRDGRILEMVARAPLGR